MLLDFCSTLTTQAQLCGTIGPAITATFASNADTVRRSQCWEGQNREAQPVSLAGFGGF